MLKKAYILAFLIVSCLPEQVNFTVYNDATEEEKEVIKNSFDWFNSIVGCSTVSASFKNVKSSFAVNNLVTEFSFLNSFLSCPQDGHDLALACMSGLDKDIAIVRTGFGNRSKKCEYLPASQAAELTYVCDDRLPIIWHELGHEFGLEHTSNEEDIMYANNHNILKVSAVDRFRNQLFEQTNVCARIRQRIWDRTHLN